jgi:threonine synthase
MNKDLTYTGLLDRYGPLLDLPSHTARVTLLEGNTSHPFTAGRRTGGGFELFAKYEGLNPTGSFKDKGMTTAIGGRSGGEAGGHLRFDRQQPPRPPHTPPAPG